MASPHIMEQPLPRSCLMAMACEDEMGKLIRRPHKTSEGFDMTMRGLRLVEAWVEMELRDLDGKSKNMKGKGKNMKGKGKDGKNTSKSKGELDKNTKGKRVCTDGKGMPADTGAVVRRAAEEMYRRCRDQQRHREELDRLARASTSTGFRSRKVWPIII